MNSRRPLVVTMGDPAGVGGEVLVAAWRSAPGARPWLCVDDPGRLTRLGAAIATVEGPEQAAAHWPDRLPVLPEPLLGRSAPGRPDPADAPAVVRSIERAVALTLEGRCAAVVTPPINKKALYDGVGFPWPGHTEFLAALGGVSRPVMLLAAAGLRAVPVTIHVSVAEALRRLDGPLLEETARVLAGALRRDFGLERPRIAVSGLNPHAGEGGSMGREEIEIIAPALERLRAEGLDVLGPLPADTMFHAGARARYDAAMCMLHDQALIPVKTLDFERGVNVTLGLPFIRTSPDHGTAYDIAGTGAASPLSFLEATRLADGMATARGS